MRHIYLEKKDILKLKWSTVKVQYGLNFLWKDMVSFYVCSLRQLVAIYPGPERTRERKCEQFYCFLGLFDVYL